MRSGDVTKIGFVCDLDDLPSIFQGRIPISDSPILTEGGGRSTSLLVAYALTPSPMAYLGLASDAMILHTINWKSVVRNENHWQGWRQTELRLTLRSKPNKTYPQKKTMQKDWNGEIASQITGFTLTKGNSVVVIEDAMEVVLIRMP